MSLTSGTRLGPYEIVSAIGAGGTGDVYTARDSRLDRTVALKVLPELMAADPQLRERFEREARTISQLNHRPAASVSASRSLMNAWRVTPIRLASRSMALRRSTGQSTFTR